jgi:hypothetical protein
VIPLLQMQAFKEDNKMHRIIQEKIERKRNHSKLISWENDLKDQKEKYKRPLNLLTKVFTQSDK